jgi:hypothetical protein
VGEVNIFLNKRSRTLKGVLFMAISFTTDILPFFASDVVTDAAYQAGGTYSLPAFFGALSLATVAIHAGSGTGYSAGDVVTLVTGGGSLYSGGAAATVTVVTAPGGVPGSLAIKTVGHYKVNPANAIATTYGGGGSGLTIDATWSGFAEQRLLTFVEIVRTYMATIDNNHEAKLLQDVLGRITASISLGAPAWDTTSMPLKAQKNALNFIAHHVFAADI